VLAISSKGGVAGPSRGPPAGAAVAPGVPSRTTTYSGSPNGRRRCCARCTTRWSFCGRARTCRRFTRSRRHRYGSERHAQNSCHCNACEKGGTSHRVYSFASPSPGDRAQLLGIALRVASAMSRPSSCACLADMEILSGSSITAGSANVEVSQRNVNSGFELAKIGSVVTYKE